MTETVILIKITRFKIIIDKIKEAQTDYDLLKQTLSMLIIMEQMIHRLHLNY